MSLSSSSSHDTEESDDLLADSEDHVADITVDSPEEVGDRVLQDNVNNNYNNQQLKFTQMIEICGLKESSNGHTLIQSTIFFHCDRFFRTTCCAAHGGSHQMADKPNAKFGRCMVWRVSAPLL